MRLSGVLIHWLKRKNQNDVESLPVRRHCAENMEARNILPSICISNCCFVFLFDYGPKYSVSSSVQWQRTIFTGQRTGHVTRKRQTLTHTNAKKKYFRHLPPHGYVWKTTSGERQSLCQFFMDILIFYVTPVVMMETQLVTSEKTCFIFAPMEK